MTSQSSNKEPESGHIMLDSVKAAEYLGVRPATLAKWRHRKIGPRYTTLVGGVRYDRDDLDRYIAANSVDPEEKAG